VTAYTLYEDELSESFDTSIADATVLLTQLGSVNNIPYASQIGTQGIKKIASSIWKAVMRAVDFVKKQVKRFFAWLTGGKKSGKNGVPGSVYEDKYVKVGGKAGAVVNMIDTYRHKCLNILPKAASLVGPGKISKKTILDVAGLNMVVEPAYPESSVIDEIESFGTFSRLEIEKTLIIKDGAVDWGPWDGRGVQALLAYGDIFNKSDTLQKYQPSGADGAVIASEQFEWHLKQRHRDWDNAAGTTHRTTSGEDIKFETNFKLPGTGASVAIKVDYVRGKATPGITIAPDNDFSNEPEVSRFVFGKEFTDKDWGSAWLKAGDICAVLDAWGLAFSKIVDELVMARAGNPNAADEDVVFISMLIKYYLGELTLVKNLSNYIVKVGSAYARELEIRYKLLKQIVDVYENRTES